MPTDDLTGQSGCTPAERVAETERLVEEFHADVYAYSRWLSGNESAAEDITQTVFLNAFRGLHNLRDRSAAKGWLLTIARHAFAAWCKKRKVESGQELPEELVEAGEQPDKRAEESEWVRHGMQSLTPEFRLVVVMYYFEQKSYADISQQLDVPIGTVMSRLSRAKKQLREALSLSIEKNATETS